ncbi:hypothetical protein JaAD80_26870 [Janthinobacterium sp. AD80]|nr:hypothetical protein JaAD80_26870 [Janthinobacterium sp. AD80]
MRRVRRGGGGAGRLGDTDVATRLDLVDGAGRAREQRRVEMQVAAAAHIALAVRIPRALRLVHRQRSRVIGGDALAGVERHVAKAEDQAVHAVDGVGPAVRAIAELDLAGVNLQAPAAVAGAAAGNQARRRGGAVPYQHVGLDARHGIAAAGAIDRRGADHQPLQRRFSRARVNGRQFDVVIEIDGVARRQRQAFQRRRTHAGIAAQQAVEDVLVQGQSGRQRVARRHRGQRRRAAHIDAAHGQHQVAGAIGGGVAQVEALVGGGGNGALGIQRSAATARHAFRAGADVDAARSRSRIGTHAGRQHVEPAIRDGQHAGRARRIHVAVARVPGRLAAAQGIDAATLLDDDAAGLAVGHQEHFAGLENGAIAHHDVIDAALELGDIGLLVAGNAAVVDGGQATDAQARGADGIQGVGPHRDPLEANGGRGSVADDFIILAGAAQQQRAAAETVLAWRVVGAAGKAQRVLGAGPGQHQFDVQRLGVAFEQRARHAVAHGLRQRECAVARFIVLRIAAQHVSRRQHRLRWQRRAQVGIAGAQLHGGGEGTIAHGRGRADGQAAGGQAVQFHAEGAGQQRKARRQQGIRAGGQAGHAGADGDLAPQRGIAGAVLGDDGRIACLRARHDGVDGIGGQARQHEAALAGGLHQRVEAGVGRAAAARKKGCAGEAAAA